MVRLRRRNAVPPHPHPITSAVFLAAEMVNVCLNSILSKRQWAYSCLFLSQIITAIWFTVNLSVFTSHFVSWCSGILNLTATVCVLTFRNVLCVLYYYFFICVSLGPWSSWVSSALIRGLKAKNTNKPDLLISWFSFCLGTKMILVSNPKSQHFCFCPVSKEVKELWTARLQNNDMGEPEMESMNSSATQRLLKD